MLFEPGSIPTAPPLETKKALILLDFQNDFVAAEGNLRVDNVEPFLPSLLSLVAEFRAKGQVIWIGTEYRQARSAISPITGAHSVFLKQHLQQPDANDDNSEYYDNPANVRSPHEDPLSPSEKPDIVHDREAFLAPVLTGTKHRCCIPGSWGADYPDLIKAAMDPQRDAVMEKSHYSAFEQTSLLMHLRMRLVTQIYVCGTLSNIAVYASVLDAVCHGMQVTLVEDCLGFLDGACHVEAVRQMADSMGASGVDCQELRDDIAGLLGDVIREEDFPTRLQVTVPPPARRRAQKSRQQIHDWISALENENSQSQSLEDDGTSSKMDKPSEQQRLSPDDSSRRFGKHKSDEHSPTRKRSTSDLEPLDEDRELKLSQKPSSRRTSVHPEQLLPAQSPQATRKRRSSRDSSNRSLTPTKSPKQRIIQSDESNSQKAMSPDSMRLRSSLVSTAGGEPRQATAKKKRRTPNIIGLKDKIGQGDTLLCLNLLDRTEAEQAFYCCKTDIRWQKMFHRSGEVPRLVAVQGMVSKDGTEMPIYRHPADESPELLPFDTVVHMLRRAAEKLVGHPLNHCLIQWYRNSEDNISEHSDKSLDIVRGSSIVNVSLGAQRTMILRAKKSTRPPVEGEEIDTPKDAPRISQRIPLPHNSIFILGQETNQHWLHSIRADKRLTAEKSPAELAFNEERISFTYRQIGTFINVVDQTIWGQGATAKTREEAKPLLVGPEAEREGEAMIRAFGQENHRSLDWNWDEWYGKGFDVVNFETKPATAEQAVFATPEDIENQFGMPKAEKRKLDHDESDTTKPGATPFTDPENEL